MNSAVKRVGLIVEGLGDRKSFPSLIAKSAEICGCSIFVTRILEAGEWRKLRSANVLEKYCRLAAIETDVDEVIVVVDLDDDCARNEYQNCLPRLGAISAQVQKPVKLVFAVKEYETWFLENLTELKLSSPDISWTEAAHHNDPCSIRGAKGRFELHLGAKYRPAIDQEKFTKRLDLRALRSTSRAYRKLLKELTGLSYAEMDNIG